ncbi:XRE family transcriptional regulator [Citreimonas salinaria]|uniref:Peptidase S24-like n=1 Tax=Citreimonas salinaria TaxID=321339 RepID=A0A1H3KSL9_9RHOB|nr:LexA family transcriptional regulator [Citreimonas salinaria]SDY54664.1 Peptidase S24-like [Citreimonas salinaria]
MNADYGQRLKAWRGQQKLSQRRLGSELGVSQGYISDIEAGRSEPSRNFLRKLSERFGVSADWLLYGEDHKLLHRVGEEWRAPNPEEERELRLGFQARRTGSRIEPSEFGRPMRGDFHYEGQDFVMINRMDLCASEPTGLIAADGGQRDALAVSRSWLLENQVHPDLSVLVEMNGDSMAPTIPNGALILIDCMDRVFSADGVFAFSRGGKSFVRRLASLDVGTSPLAAALAVISDNPNYPIDVIRDSELEGVSIVGRVRRVVSNIL